MCPLYLELSSVPLARRHQVFDEHVPLQVVIGPLRVGLKLASLRDAQGKPRQHYVCYV